MYEVAFGNTGITVSALGFGSAPFGFLDVEAERVDVLLNRLLDSGITVLDTAASYPGSEEGIGRAVGDRRGEYTLVSKCGNNRGGELPGDDWSRELISASIDRSLQRLRTDHVEVMLLHSCSLEILQRGESFDALARARDAGKILHAGYSGDNEALAWAVQQPDVAAIETSINICDHANIDTVSAAQRRGLGVLAKRPVANAAWKKLDDQPGMYANYAKSYSERFRAMGLSLQELDVDGWAEVALRFTLSVPGVNVAIVGTTNPEHVATNRATVDSGPLTESAIRNIKAAFTAAMGESGETWLGLT